MVNRDVGCWCPEAMGCTRAGQVQTLCGASRCWRQRRERLDDAPRFMLSLVTRLLRESRLGPAPCSGRTCCEEVMAATVPLLPALVLFGRGAEAEGLARRLPLRLSRRYPCSARLVCLKAKSRESAAGDGGGWLWAGRKADEWLRGEGLQSEGAVGHLLGLARQGRGAGAVEGRLVLMGRSTARRNACGSRSKWWMGAERLRLRVASRKSQVASHRTATGERRSHPYHLIVPGTTKSCLFRPKILNRFAALHEYQVPRYPVLVLSINGFLYRQVPGTCRPRLVPTADASPGCDSSSSPGGEDQN